MYLEAWTGEAWGEWMRERRAEKVRLASGAAYGQGERVDLESDEEVAEEEVVGEEPVEVKGMEKIKIPILPQHRTPLIHHPPPLNSNPQTLRRRNIPYSPPSPTQKNLFFLDIRHRTVGKVGGDDLAVAPRHTYVFEALGELTLDDDGFT